MMNVTPMVRATDVIKLPIISCGKVRESFRLTSWKDMMLLVATDRISAFDVVMPDPIPGKGTILTKMSKFWFDLFGDACAQHMVTADERTYPAECMPFRAQLAGRSMIVRKYRVIPVECIVRGNLTGSYYSAFKKAEVKSFPTESPTCNPLYKDVHGFRLPAEMMESDVFPQPIFTPSTKAEMGAHDENISFEQMCTLLTTWLKDPSIVYSGTGYSLGCEMHDLAIKLYKIAYEHAAKRGIVIADTKFEMGLSPDGRLILIDEVLTPDSSRFWPADKVIRGATPPSFDKQFLRDWLKVHWKDRTQPPPSIPADIIDQTVQKYHEIYYRLTGSRG